MLLQLLLLCTTAAITSATANTLVTGPSISAGCQTAIAEDLNAKSPGGCAVSCGAACRGTLQQCTDCYFTGGIDHLCGIELAACPGV